MDYTVEKVMYQFNYDRIRVSIPVRWNQVTANQVLQVLDSLARVGGYNNFRIVNLVSCNLARLCDDFNNAEWKKEISIKAVKLDMDYSARFNYSPAVCCLQGFLYTPEIINRIRSWFHSPYLSEDDAETIAKWEYKPDIPRDTSGYETLKRKSRLDTNESNRYYNIYSFLQTIQKSGQTIKQYYDSINRVNYEYKVNRLKGKLWDGCYNIISNAGQKRIYSMAALIDSFVTPEIQSKMYTSQPYRIPRILARLKYRDYPQQQEKKYMHIMDSCLLYLKEHPTLGMDSVRQIALTLTDCYDKMDYTDVAELQYKMSPVLLATNKFKPQFGEIKSVGAFFIDWRLWIDIRNLPLPENMLIDDWDKNNIPYKVYQWMQKNRNNYQFNPNLLKNKENVKK